jgi:hypothetical protein
MMKWRLCSRGALDTYEKEEGANGIDVANALTNLEELYREQEKFDLAEPLLVPEHSLSAKLVWVPIAQP